MTFALERQIIFVALAGSHAHGTAREESDVDLRGVCVAPLSQRLSLFSNFEQYEGPLEGALARLVMPMILAHPTASRGLGVKAECVIFDAAKFISLCAAANPNALEILFADDSDWVHDTPAWRRLHQQRRRFLTRKLQQTFLGYALGQLKKIKTHRSWLLHPPAQKPRREDFGLPEAGTLSRDDQNRIELGIADKLRSYGIKDVEMPKPTRIAVEDRLRSFWQDTLGTTEEELELRMRAVANQALELPPGVVATLNAEKRYRAAMKHWESYQTWNAQRNPARAALEQRHGYDTKHAMHLIRLMRMGLEVLQQGDLLVRRPDAHQLNAIRDGAWSYGELLDQAEDLQQQMESAVKRCALPADIDHEFVDQLAFELMSDTALGGP
jgi:predicted nucleotidyltransferase